MAWRAASVIHSAGPSRWGVRDLSEHVPAPARTCARRRRCCRPRRGGARGAARALQLGRVAPQLLDEVHLVLGSARPGRVREWRGRGRVWAQRGGQIEGRSGEGGEGRAGARQGSSGGGQGSRRAGQAALCVAGCRGAAAPRRWRPRAARRAGGLAGERTLRGRGCVQACAPAAHQTKSMCLQGHPGNAEGAGGISKRRGGVRHQHARQRAWSLALRAAGPPTLAARPHGCMRRAGDRMHVAVQRAAATKPTRPTLALPRAASHSRAPLVGDDCLHVCPPAGQQQADVLPGRHLVVAGWRGPRRGCHSATNERDVAGCQQACSRSAPLAGQGRGRADSQPGAREARAAARPAQRCDCATPQPRPRLAAHPGTRQPWRPRF